MVSGRTLAEFAVGLLVGATFGSWLASPLATPAPAGPTPPATPVPTRTEPPREPADDTEPAETDVAELLPDGTRAWRPFPGHLRPETDPANLDLAALMPRPELVVPLAERKRPMTLVLGGRRVLNDREYRTEPWPATPKGFADLLRERQQAVREKCTTKFMMDESRTGTWRVQLEPQRRGQDVADANLSQAAAATLSPAERQRAVHWKRCALWELSSAQFEGRTTTWIDVELPLPGPQAAYDAEHTAPIPERWRGIIPDPDGDGRYTQ